MNLPESTITCPQCGHATREEVPDGVCLAFYRCKGCGHLLKPAKGDCCVFCAWGSEPCQRVRQGKPFCG